MTPETGEGEDPAKVDKGEERRKSARFGWKERRNQTRTNIIQNYPARRSLPPSPVSHISSVEKGVLSRRGGGDGGRGRATYTLVRSVRNLVIVERGTSCAVAYA